MQKQQNEICFERGWLGVLIHYVNLNKALIPKAVSWGFCKKRCSSKLCKIQRKTLVLESFFNKFASITPAILLKKGLWHSCFPVNFAEFLTALFLRNTTGGCLCNTNVRFVLVIIKGMSTVDQSIDTNSVWNLFKTYFFNF